MKRHGLNKTQRGTGKSEAEKNERGQSTLEFTLTLLLVLAFFFFFFQLAVTFAFGNYVHYAVFMAARTYASAGVSEKDQHDRAEEVITEMLGGSNGDRYRRFGEGVAINGSSSNFTGFEVGKIGPYVANRYDGWMQGARYHFRSKIFPISLVPGRAPRGGQASQDETSLLLKAESFLGREPAFAECDTQMKNTASGKGRSYDNGC